MDHVQWIQEAIRLYGFKSDNIEIIQELSPQNKHGDRHVTIRVDEQGYSARLLATQRYKTDAFVELSDEVLREQIRFGTFLRDSGIPFMKNVQASNGEAFVTVHLQHKKYRVVLFEWIEGVHLTQMTADIARTFGAFARKIHDRSSLFEAQHFPQVSHLKGYQQFYNEISFHVNASQLLPQTKELLTAYLENMQKHLAAAQADTYDFIVQSDLNPLNILWDDRQEIIGIVDFESITYTDRVEGLAWLVKWYSRTHGIYSHELSPVLAQSLLQGYRADELLTKPDWLRLPSLLVLTGCLNWNFTDRTIALITNGNDHLLQKHIRKYEKRAASLLSLLEI